MNQQQITRRDRALLAITLLACLLGFLMIAGEQFGWRIPVHYSPVDERLEGLR
jgi:hypothetical protein